MDGAADCWREGGAEMGEDLEVAILALPASSLGGLYATYDDFRAIGRFPEAVRPARRFRPRIVNLSGRPEPSLTGATIHPMAGLDAARRAAIVVIPAQLDLGDRVRGEETFDAPPEALAWLRERHADGAVIAGMCTGAFLMAEAGLLERREATTHWYYEAAFRRRHPGVRMISRGTLVAPGPGGRLITGGASVYPSETSLQLIAAHAGLAAAQQFAHLFGRYWRGDLAAVRAENGLEPPEIDDGAVAVACAWIEANLQTRGLVRGAAAAAMLTERTLARRFQRALGASPADYVARKRMERARLLLETSRLPVDEVAARVGYAEPSAFRRAFRKLTGLAPAEHRRRFKLPPGEPA
ncbi:MAG: helix-turn-helix domain-containing protein [Pseudomonadota bacterium]